MKKSTITKFIFALVVLIVLGPLGCDNNGVGTQTDVRAERFLSRFVEKHPLVLAPGEAWIEVDHNNLGFIFYEDGRFDHIVLKDGAWVADESGLWSAHGGIDWGWTFTYRFVGSVLVMECENVLNIRLVKVSGIQIINQ